MAPKRASSPLVRREVKGPGLLLAIIVGTIEVSVRRGSSRARRGSPSWIGVLPLKALDPKS